MGKGQQTRRPLALSSAPVDPRYWEQIRVLSIRRLAKHGVHLPPDSGKEYVAKLTTEFEQSLRNQRRPRP